MASFIALNDLPRAMWVVATTVNIPGRTRLGPEWPLGYRFGFERPLSAAQQVNLANYLLQKPSVRSLRQYSLDRPQDVPAINLSLSAEMTDADSAQQVFEVIVADPRQNRRAIREIKEIVRPICPYTALVVHSAQKMSGNTGMLWIAVRDELTAAECARLCNQLPKLRDVHTAVLRGASTFELRVDYKIVKKCDLMISRLAVLGIFPDFRAEASGVTYEAVISPASGL